MVIGHLSAYDDKSPNGVIKVVYELTKEQVSQGHKVFVYGFKKELSAVEIIRSVEGVLLMYFPKGNKINGHLSYMFLQYLQNNPDHLDFIHFHSVYKQMNIVAARYCSMPYIVTPHGGYSLISRNKSFFTKIKKSIYEIIAEKQYLHKSIMIQALSDYEKQELTSIFPFVENKIDIIPNGTPHVLYRANVSNERMLQIAFIGRLDIYHKGLDILLNGLAEYVRNGKNNINVEIVGPGNDDVVEKIVEMIRCNSLENVVKLRGPLFSSKKENFLRTHVDLFVHTSRWEGLPLSVLEALSYGIPVMVSKETNIGNFVKDYDAGWVLVNNSPDCVAHTLEKVLKDKDYKQKGINAKKLADCVFSWKEVTRLLCSHVQVRIDHLFRCN